MPPALQPAESIRTPPTSVGDIVLRPVTAPDSLDGLLLGQGLGAYSRSRAGETLAILRRVLKGPEGRVVAALAGETLVGYLALFQPGPRGRGGTARPLPGVPCPPQRGLPSRQRGGGRPPPAIPGGRLHRHIANDPHAERFDVDRDAAGNPVAILSSIRNPAEELRAMRAGLAPGQVRRGLRLFRQVLPLVEAFAGELGKEQISVEALFYHHAFLYERHGFGYLTGRDRLEEVHRGFQPGGVLRRRLDGSTPFRMPDASGSVRGRSWAIHAPARHPDRPRYPAGLLEQRRRNQPGPDGGLPGPDPRDRGHGQGCPDRESLHHRRRGRPPDDRDWEPGKRLAVIRIKTMNPQPILKDLAAAGFEQPPLHP